MARRGHRRTLAPNIFEDGSGRSVKVTVGGRTLERRFPSGTPLDQLEIERDALKGLQAAARPPAPGTLRADVVAYLRTIDDEAKRKGQQILCAHWVAAYGHVSRSALTPLVIRQQLAAWRRAGAAASSCNHRLSALRAVWRAVADPDEPNYPAQVKKLPEPSPEPRALSYDVIAQILAAMPDRGKPTGQGKGTRPTVSLTKLRLTLMAYGGLPPAQMARIDPATDIDWPTSSIRLRPRRKGKGAAEVWVQLIPQALDALRGLVAAKALPGRYSTSAAYKTWQLACVKVIRQQIADRAPTLPHVVDEAGAIHPRVRPYDLRHSFGTAALIASGGDLRGVQHLLQHASTRQTERYTVAAVPERAARAVTALSAAIPAVPRSTLSPTGAPTRKRQRIRGK